MKLKQILAGALSAAMVLTSVPVTAHAADVTQESETQELTSVRKDNPELGDVELTEEELAYLNNASSGGIVINVVFKHNTIPGANVFNPIVTLTGADNKYFTVNHAATNGDTKGVNTIDMTGLDNGWMFSTEPDKIADNKWHKLSMVLDANNQYYSFLDGVKATDFGTVGTGVNANKNWAKQFNSFLGHSAFTITGMKVGKVLDGVSYNYTKNGVTTTDFDGVVKYVEIKDLAVADVAGALAQNTETSATLKSDFAAYVAGLNYDQTQYTPESWTAYATAKETADALVANESAGEWAIYNAKDALEAAVAGLEKSETPVVVYDYEEVDNKVLEKNATANTEMFPADGTDGPAEWAFDGDDSHWWHSRWGNWESVGKNDPNDVLTSEDKAKLFTDGGPTAWIGSAFDESILLGKFQYQCRSNGNNAMGNWKLWVANMSEGEPTKDDWKVVAASVDIEGAEKHAAFPDGKLQTVVLNTPVQATHFKLEALGLAEKTGGDSHAVTASTIKVYKAVPQQPEAPEVTAAKEALKAVVDAAETDGTIYTEASWAAYQAALTAAQETLADNKATVESVNAAKAALEAAAAGLEKAPYVYTEVDNKVLQENATANTEQYPAQYTYDGTADWAFDNDMQTRWSSRYDWSSGFGENDKNDVITAEQRAKMFQEDGPTPWISSSFNESILLGKLEYQGRIDSQKGQNAIGDWKLWVADVAEGQPTEDDWKVVAASVDVEGAEKHATFPNGEMQSIVLNTPVKATHFKLEVLSLAATIGSGDTTVVAAAEIKVYKATPQQTEDPEVTAAKEALQAVVDNAKTDADNYTEESWAAYQEALAAAEAAIADKKATVESVNAAKTALEEAEANLKTKLAAAKEALQAEVDGAKAAYEAGNDNGLYTEESWTAFTTAYDNAVAELAKEDATIESLDAAKAALVSAKNMELAKEAAGMPVVKVAAPAAGEKAAAATAEYVEAVEEKLEDAAENPAELVRSEGLQIVQDGAYAAIDGKLSVAHTDNDKFMVTGNNKYLFKFMLKASEPTDGENHTVLQKEAGNYGLQINKAEKLLKVYCHSTGGWPQTNYNIPAEGFWDTWHEVILMYDGDGFRMFVDGTAGKADTGRPTSFTLSDSYTGDFAVGNADLGTDKGDKISVRVANVEMYTGDQVPATDAESTADSIKAALAEKTANFKLDAVAGQEAAGSECTVESTTWTDEDGNVMGEEDTFKEYTDYTMTVVLKANDHYVFADADKPATIKAGEADVPVEAVISADRTKMTITWTYDGGEDPRVEVAAELQKVIDAAQAKFDEGNDGKYDADLWTALETALAAAKEEVKKADATVESLGAAQANLEKALTDLAEAEGIEITGVSVRHYNLSAGEEAKDPLVVPGKDGTRYEVIADRAENPADLQANDAMKYEYQTDETGYASWGFNGELTDMGGGTGTKFDVYGEENPLLLRFKVRVQNKEDVPSGTTAKGDEKTMQLLGKMDNQYGVQLMQDKVIVYGDAINPQGAWVQSECAIDDSFWGKWHEIIVVFTGNRMQLYVDGKAGQATANRPNDKDPSVTLKHNSSSVFTTGYNKTKREQNFEDAYVPFNGYLADVEMYTDKDYTEGLTATYGAICKALDSAVPTANITLKPFSSRTDWYKVVNGEATEIASGTTLEEHTVYKAVTTLTAHKGYKFTQTTSEDATVAIEVSADGSTMTVTKTYDATAEIQCQCTLGDITLADQKVVLEADEAPKTITLKPKAEVKTNGCKIHETNSATFAYEVTEGNGTVATVTAEGVVTAKAVGTASIKVTATMPKKDGEAAATAEKTITLTVTSKKATAEEKKELTDTITTAQTDLKPDELTEDSYKALADAIEEANKVLAKANASKDEVAAAIAAVEAAKANLKTKLDVVKEEFLALNQELSAMDRNLYTIDSWNKVVDANAAAKAAFEKAGVTYDELAPLVAALKTAKDALVQKDVAELAQAKADLAKALAAAKALIDAGQKNYTDATWKAFKDAYAAAAAAPANATAAALKDLVSKLTAAQKALAATGKTPGVIRKGEEYDTASGRYAVINASKKTAKLVKASPKNKKKAKVGVPATVKLNGVKCKVVEVGPNAFKGFKNLKTITLGANVKTINKNAFAGCKKLSQVVVKGTVLKTIKAGAFKKTAKKMTVTFKSKKVSAKKRKALLKKMKKAGMSKSAKLK